jgi:hypothetical protein
VGAIPSALLALILAAALTVTWYGAREEIGTYPFTIPETADPTVDRTRMRAMFATVSQTPTSLRTRLRFFSRVDGDGRRRTAARRQSESYWESNVRSALMDGLAVRVLFPNVESVEFVRAFSRDDPDVRWAVYRPAGDLRVATTRELDSLLTSYRRPRSRR